MATTTQKSVDKWKLKKWFEVYPPKVISEEVIGSVPAADDKSIVGRIMKVNLSWITHNFNHSFSVVGLRVTDTNSNAANTSIAYLEQQYSYLHSLVKRHSDVVYTRDKVNDKDGKAMTFKLLITTKSRVPAKTKAVIRKNASAFVIAYAAARNREELIKSLISGELQGEGITKLGETAPIAKVEIKRIEF